MSNKFSNFFEEFKSLKKIQKKNFPKSHYKNEKGKENSENINNESDYDMQLLEQKSGLQKWKKEKSYKKFNVSQKEFYKKGKSKRFNLFRENEIRLDEWDKKTEVLEQEEDYDSDEDVIRDGKNKVKDDLDEALRIFRKNKFNEIISYAKYYKFRNDI